MKRKKHYKALKILYVEYKQGREKKRESFILMGIQNRLKEYKIS
jgi:hypothetical protein